MTGELWREPYPRGYCLCLTEYGCMVHAAEIEAARLERQRRRLLEISDEWLAVAKSA